MAVPPLVKKILLFFLSFFFFFAPHGPRPITISIAVAMGCAADSGFGTTSENTQSRGDRHPARIIAPWPWPSPPRRFNSIFILFFLLKSHCKFRRNNTNRMRCPRTPGRPIQLSGWVRVDITRLGALGGVQCSYSGFCRFFLPFCCSGLRVSPVVMSSLNLFISPQLPSKNAADPTHARTPVLSAILHAYRNMRSVRRVFYQKTSHSLHAAPLLAAGARGEA